MADAITEAIATLKKVQTVMVDLPSTMTQSAEDTKRAELRLGVGSNGLLPRYSKPYLVLKSTLDTYLAPGGKADLFRSGKWSNSIKTVAENGVLSNKLENPPSYAKHVAEYSGGEPEGWSDKGAKNLLRQAGLKLKNQIAKIVNV